MIASLVAASLLGSQKAPDPPQEYKMHKYVFVMLKTGKEIPTTADENTKLMQEHQANFRRLSEAGKLQLVGPTLDAKNGLRGIVVLDAASKEEAAKMLEPDPMIQSGRLKTEMHFWWSAEGIMKGVVNPAKIKPHRLVLLKSAPNPPAATPDELKEIMAGHMANINKLADDGSLGLAGPFEGAGELRGIFVMNLTDDEAIREKLKGDTAIARGRLVAEIIPLYLSEGALRSLKK